MERDIEKFNLQLLVFRDLVVTSYDHIAAHPEKEPVVDRLVEYVSARFSKEPNYAVVIPPEVECGECFHPVSDHGKNGCEHERTITVEGIEIDGECGCKEHRITDRLQRLLQRAYEQQEARCE